ncbi:uncharacterized protein LOC111801581 [Cucurbita pepo subsp. pepo]|uniref:uncharacterized protein LOC111801581 n=1 Tax=Cucurbita pepo subsp. pepo TaxID=3664 RepID=UPI000C9D6E6D|nr:uncharacterized protein LOC111801581 [Cucurbita pepo subsp. pepo]
MDQHLHYQQQWNSRPIQGTVCPICAMPHFPFCPPHPSFNQNPRYPFGPDPPFQRPGFDPHRSPMGMPRPSMGNLDDGFADQRPWIRNSANSYGHLPFQPHREESFLPPPYDYGGNEFVNDAERSYKRPRVDDVGLDGGVHEVNQNQKSGRSSFEDERRLKLIRDHGVVSSGPSYENSVGSGDPEEVGTTRNLEINHFQDSGNGDNDGRSQNFHDEGNLAPAKQFQNGREGYWSDLKHAPAAPGNRIDPWRPSQNEELSHSRYDQGGGHWHAQHMPRPVPPEASEDSYLSHRNELHYSDNPQAFSWMDDRNNSKMNILDRDYRPPPRSEMNPTHMRPFSSHGNAHHGTRNFNYGAGYAPRHSGGVRFFENGSSIEDSRFFDEQPPLPTSPPPPMPWEAKPSSLFPVPVSVSPITSSQYSSVPEHRSLHHLKPMFHVSSSPMTEDSLGVHPYSKKFAADGKPYGVNQLPLPKPKVIDASHLFKRPHRSTRPDHIVVILRGLPGSGKSYLAKMLRDVEIENGGDAPRIHSMDDYFMTEVEKVEEGDTNSSNSVKGKKPIVKKVMEYCYEPEMEEAYRSSMLKAFRKTLEEGVFTFVIVDDRNLRVADFAQFWAIAKSSGYEVYILEATYRDPTGCAARNVHGFNLDDIQKMARQWEEAPALYLQLDIKSLCHGDDLKESGIKEVDMDMEDEDDDTPSSFQETKSIKTALHPQRDDASEDDGKRWDEESDHRREEVKELGRSKWSNDLDDDDTERTDGANGHANALSGLIQAYAKEGKSVRWIDQAGYTGFSIGAAKKANRLSLVIGPGAGYNLKSNPLPEEYQYRGSNQNSNESKKHSRFEERLRAESESFKVVFDKRRQRIGGLDWEEE